MTYVYLGIAIVILFLVSRIIRWWNLPKVAQARADKAKVRQEGRTERVKIRREGKKRREFFFKRKKLDRESKKNARKQTTNQ
jgi:hypothetical protein